MFVMKFQRIVMDLPEISQWTLCAFVQTFGSPAFEKFDICEIGFKFNKTIQFLQPKLICCFQNILKKENPFAIIFQHRIAQRLFHIYTIVWANLMVHMCIGSSSIDKYPFEYKFVEGLHSNLGKYLIKYSENFY